MSSKTMQHLTRLLVSATFLLFSSYSTAQVFTSYGIQYPVWLERNDGAKTALGPGMTVLQGDRVVTGKGGKVWLNMPDQALVKLGEQGSIGAGVLTVSTSNSTVANMTEADVSDASVSATDKENKESKESTSKEGEVSRIEGAFSVLQGAFRYTTQKLNTQWQRSLEINLAQTTTIGIRGTDLWGRVDTAEQFVVLLEGVISVASQNSDKEVTLDAPLSIYTASTEAVSAVEMSAVQALAPETELDFGSGIQLQSGAFQLHLASFPTQAGAQQLRSLLSDNGLFTVTNTVEVDGKQWHRLSVPGIKTLDGAKALLQRISEQFGLLSIWVDNA